METHRENVFWKHIKKSETKRRIEGWINSIAPQAEFVSYENFNKYEINTDTKEPLFALGYYDAFLPSEGIVNTAQNAEDFQPRYSEILKDAEYYKNIRALHKQKQFEPCLSQAQLSIYLGRASEKVLFAKATCYSGLKQYQQALTMLDILQKIYPNAFMRNQAKFRKFLNRRVNASKVI